MLVFDGCGRTNVCPPPVKWTTLHFFPSPASQASMPPSCARAFTGAGVWAIVVGCGAAADAMPATAKNIAVTINARTA